MIIPMVAAISRFRKEISPKLIWIISWNSSEKPADFDEDISGRRIFEKLAGTSLSWAARGTDCVRHSGGMKHPKSIEIFNQFRPVRQVIEYFTSNRPTLIGISSSSMTSQMSYFSDVEDRSPFSSIERGRWRSFRFRFSSKSQTELNRVYLKNSSIEYQIITREFDQHT